MKIFRYLAAINIAIGALLLISAGLSSIGLFRAANGAGKLIGGLLVVLLFLISVTMIRSGIAHLKHPARDTAGVVAANFAVVLWIAITGGMRAAAEAMSLGLTFNLLSIVTAYLAYRLVLRPAALRAFPPTAPKA